MVLAFLIYIQFRDGFSVWGLHILFLVVYCM
nr:MAG TPA: hypothetical protein [Bacteriophage sp.]DAV41862.1 MAG TPA: hypothetical protein [Bacteriophage sp.]